MCQQNLILYLFSIRWFPTLRSYEYLSDLPIPNITQPLAFRSSPRWALKCILLMWKLKTPLFPTLRNPPLSTRSLTSIVRLMIRRSSLVWWSALVKKRATLLSATTTTMPMRLLLMAYGRSSCCFHFPVSSSCQTLHGSLHQRRFGLLLFYHSSLRSWFYLGWREPQHQDHHSYHQLQLLRYEDGTTGDDLWPERAHACHPCGWYL